ncbi:ABC transporter permease [Nocardioides sp. J54]|uniref:ABC transporter permease n=1 Tax=Nocardioides sp. J54 TaxID=935866 RepID=UPI00048DE58F|nr:ABC transporter permease [Nocardioides sp. J54]
MNTVLTRFTAAGRFVIRDYAVGVVLVAVCVYLSVRSPQFSTAANVSNVLDQVSMIGIITMGMAILLVSANFDLSVGGMVGLATVVTAKVINDQGLAVGVAAGIGVAALLGAINGIIVTKLKVNSLVATLGSGLAYTGLALLWSESTPIPVTDTALTDFMNTKMLGVSMPAYFFLGAILLATWFLHITVAGQQTYAVGANAEAARYAGVRVELIRFIPFVLTGLFAGVASIILTGLLGSGVPTAASSWPLQVVAGAVVGGISIAGGRGTIAMGVLGVLLIGIINNGLNLLNFDAAYQNIATGAILVAAVAVDSALQAFWRNRPPTPNGGSPGAASELTGEHAPSDGSVGASAAPVRA